MECPRRSGINNDDDAVAGLVGAVTTRGLDASAKPKLRRPRAARRCDPRRSNDDVAEVS